MAMGARQMFKRLEEIDMKLEEVDFDIENEGPNKRLVARREALVEEMVSLRKSLKLLVK